MLVLSTRFAHLEKRSLIDAKTRFTGFGHPGQFRSILNDVTQQFLPDGFYWLLCLKALSELAGTLGHTLALRGTGGELISAR